MDDRFLTSRLLSPVVLLSTARKCGSPGEGRSFVVASVRKEIARPAGRGLLVGESFQRLLEEHQPVLDLTKDAWENGLEFDRQAGRSLGARSSHSG